ncbi:MAG: SAM-dependent chlorinase/fluorinase [Deltaproteobacteria bacterium]|nr:SAM-dependent chlorinase/fluorinase [Deltaproteobacteria bacterium]
MSGPIITLTTDFGLIDAYVGQVKGVILGLCPEAVVVDLTHQVPPRHILRAGLIVASSQASFPAGTIHLAVVDPGVGTTRRALVVSAGGHLFVAPDNGLLTPILRDHPQARVWVISEKAYLRPCISPTFHGRDIFAPAAGHLAAGLSPALLGPEIDDPVRLDLDQPRWEGQILKGQVLFSDHFGNLITNITAAQLDRAGLPGAPRFKLAGQILTGLHLTYAEVKPGKPLALIGSLDLVEIGVNQGRADEFFQAGEGAAVEVIWGV